MAAKHALDGEMRLLRTYAVHVQLAQRAIDEDRDHHEVYERAFLDGLARAVFDVTGLWPGEHPHLPRLRPKAGL